MHGQIGVCTFRFIVLQKVLKRLFATIGYGIGNSIKRLITYSEHHTLIAKFEGKLTSVIVSSNSLIPNPGRVEACLRAIQHPVIFSCQRGRVNLVSYLYSLARRLVTQPCLLPAVRICHPSQINLSIWQGSLRYIDSSYMNTRVPSIFRILSAKHLWTSAKFTQ